MDDNELPGMWEQADLTGGATDQPRPIEQQPPEVRAAYHLARRAGAAWLEVVPDVDAPDLFQAGARWQGHNQWIGVRGYSTPEAAALALARKMMDGATCRCLRQCITDLPIGAAVPDDKCLWTLVGDRWVPGCNAPPITVREDAAPGDTEAIRQAFDRLTIMFGRIPCETCNGTGTVPCAAHIAGDGCLDMKFLCPDCG